MTYVSGLYNHHQIESGTEIANIHLSLIKTWLRDVRAANKRVWDSRFANSLFLSLIWLSSRGHLSFILLLILLSINTFLLFKLYFKEFNNLNNKNTNV